MIESGCGMSTLLAAEAIRVNATEGHACRFSAIDAHPADYLRGGVPGLAELLEATVESIPIEQFSSLGENDILFIDSPDSIVDGVTATLLLSALPSSGCFERRCLWK